LGCSEVRKSLFSDGSGRRWGHFDGHCFHYAVLLT
jgi:hypothetical protein